MSYSSNPHNKPADKAPPRPEGHQPPVLSLPKGGGALRSIGEKFSVNPANGTSSLGLPLPFSQPRGSGPALALQYNSGSGNGPFGLGWSLGLSSIQRRTDKMLPRYRDADEGDVFLLAGAEDLVPAYRRTSTGAWVAEASVIADVTVERYRPRIEGLFARVEKISVAGQAGFYWKVTTRDNVATFYGLTAGGRVADPGDLSRIFRWLPELTYDGHGNCFEYSYKAEDLAGVPSSVEEQNRRSGLTRFTNTYLKRIRYGNKTPYIPDPAATFKPVPPNDPSYFFEAVLDYGEHDVDRPEPAEAVPWACRYDPFSDRRAGFDIRTYRLCRRILFFNSFAELSVADGPVEPCLVQSMDLTYQYLQFTNQPYERHEADLIATARQVHYRRTNAGYDRKSEPAAEFDYHKLSWSAVVQDVSPGDVVNAPAGVTDGYQFVDLYSEGVSGILTEQANAWYYKRNLGDGHFDPAASEVPKPSFTGLATGSLQIQDLDADGSRQAVVRMPGVAGSFALGDDGRWQPFRGFKRVPWPGAADPNARFIDLNGDGKADLLMTDELVLRWYASLGTDGFDAPEQTPKPLDEARGPVLLFADGTETIFLADMSGDGLTDIVRIRNADVCYWPNLGYGAFGAKICMRDAPLFDRPECFDPSRVRLFDVSGTGAADLLYLGAGTVTAWINLAGNAWAPAQAIGRFPLSEHPSHVTVLDLLGNGTGCLVWSSGLPVNAAAPLRYIDLMGGRKPYLLSGYRNGFGAETWLEYRSSSYYYLRDRAAGRPWVTHLPFPTMCLSRHEQHDAISGSRFVQEYSYRHGYYDHAEREFRGFAMVEQTDTEEYERFAGSGAHNLVDATLHQAPMRTRSWFHTGAFLGGVDLLNQFSADYFQNPAMPEYRLPDLPVDDGAALTPEERRQAARACKGMLLRQEVYADDGSPRQALPFSTAEHGCRVRLVQPQMANRYAVFLTHESEALEHQYERDPADPRVSHTLNTALDDLGNVLESATVTYGRLTADATLPPEVQQAQARLLISYSAHLFTNDVLDDAHYRRRQPCEVRRYELTGAVPAAGRFTLAEIQAAFQGASGLGYEQALHAGFIEKRLLDLQRTVYAGDADPNLPLPFAALQPLGLHYENYALTLTPSLLTALYGARVDPAMLAEGRFLLGDDAVASGRFPATDPGGLVWTASGIVQYPAHPEQHFYLPERFIDAAGTATTVRYYADYHLMVDRTEDALGNRVTVEAFDFRFLLPWRTRDINDNLVEAAFDISGRVVGTAVLGKGAEADDLGGFAADLTDAQVAAFLADPVGAGPALLANASSRFIYSLTAVPAVAASIVRETHHQAELATGTPSKLQYAFEYTDGGGHVVMTKLQAEPGRAKMVVVQGDTGYAVTEIDTTPHRRWVGNGRTVLNNKGNPVLRYEPYFAVTPAYETAPELVETGVSPVMYYDAPGRLVRTTFPDGTLSRVEIGNWATRTFDRNDTVLASDWYAARIGGALGLAEQSAAQKTALHDSTPATAHADSQGRTIYAVAHNRFIDRLTSALTEEFYGTRSELDVEGNLLVLYDPRGNAVMRYAYDQLGRQAFANSMDSGERRILHDGLGKPLYGWDAKGSRFHTVYDVLHRPSRHEVLTAAATLMVTERAEYGTDPALNENGQPLRRLEPAGVVTFDGYDFAGNLLQSTRRFVASPDGDTDWTTEAAVALDGRSFTTSSTYDALKRVVESVAPDGSRTLNHYNESNLLSGVEVGIRGGALQAFVTRIDHDAKGKRQRIVHGNAASTAFTYDPATLRVATIVTTRAADGARLQDLRYTYDPVGNISGVRDAAQQAAYFNNAVVSPDGGYTYDAVYRLVAAAGREQIALNTPPDPWDGLRVRLPHKADGAALQGYLQQYEYDAAGNMAAMAHSAGAGLFTNRWTRKFAVEANTNRLASSTVGVTTEGFSYDVHGNLTATPHLATIGWDVDNHLRHADLGGGGHAWYTYDAEGQRARKVVQRPGGLTEERLYMGALEVFRRTRNGVVLLERETLHVLDHDRRLALIDTRTAGDDGGAAQLIRYQFSNHLGTATLELDDLAAVISYEEYYPFGSTSFQSVDSAREVPAKRYRYTAKERDEETGLYYHGARYYAPWLARWTAPDPLGIKDGSNRYLYSGNRPMGSSDPSGLWEMPSWRTVAIVAAVVVVGVAVTVVTAGLAGPAIAAAATAAAGAAGLGATGAAIVSGAAVGAAVGAAGGLASGVAGEATRQAVNSKALGLGQGEFSGGAIAKAGAEGFVTGLVGGALTGGVAGGLTQVARGGALGAKLATQAVSSGSPAIPTVSRVGLQAARLARNVVIGAASGSVGSAGSETARQLVNREPISGDRILHQAAVGGVLGGAVPAAIRGGQALRSALTPGCVVALSNDVRIGANAYEATELRGSVPRGTQVFNSHGGPGRVEINGTSTPISALAADIERSSAENVIIRACKVGGNPTAFRDLATATGRTVTAYTEPTLMNLDYMNPSVRVAAPGGGFQIRAGVPTTFVGDTTPQIHALSTATVIGLTVSWGQLRQ